MSDAHPAQHESQADPPQSPDEATAAAGRPGIAAGVSRPGLVLAFLAVAQFMVFLDVSIVNVALPSIEAALGIQEENLPRVVTLYGTALGGLLLFGSRLADTFGRRRILQIGLAVFGVASLAAGIAQDQSVLFAARGLQGVGSALIAPAALSILTTTFIGGAERAKALGLWGALTGIASVAGVTLGGVLSDGPGWRWIFFINVPVAIVTVLLAPRVLTETHGPRRRFDTAGALLLTGGLLALLYALEEAISHGWTDTVVLTSLGGAALLLLGFVVAERRATAPLVPLDVFAARTLRYANLATLFLLGTVVTVFFFASLFLQQVLDYTPLQAGLAYVPLAVVVAVGAGLASGLVAKIPGKVVLAVGLLLLAMALLILARTPSSASYVSGVLPAFLLAGLGMGLSFVPLQIAAQAGVPEERAGLAAGLINTSQEVGGALGVAVAATYAFRRVDELTAAAAGDSRLTDAARTTVFHDGFAAGTGFAIAALLITVFLLPAIPQTRKPRRRLAQRLSLTTTAQVTRPTPRRTRPMTTSNHDTAVLLRRALAQVDALTEQVTAEALHAPTPCPDYDVTALVDHMVLIANRVATATSGQTQTTERADDVPARWASSVARLRSALDNTDPDAVVELPFGRMPLTAAYGVYVGEFTTHGWDLAVAIDRHDLLDQDLGQAALALVTARIPSGQRDHTPFAAVVPVAESAPTYDRLAGWMGRDPARWTGQ